MKKSILLFITLSGLFHFNSCEKETVSPSQEDISLDSLSQAQIDLLEELETDYTTQISDVNFNDGTSVLTFLQDKDPEFLEKIGFRVGNIKLTAEEKLKLILARMQAVGFYLVTRPYHQYQVSIPGQNDQNGLAYSYGSKQYANPQSPVGKCNIGTQFYGLDCSGMIYQMARHSGIRFLADSSKYNAAYLGDTSNWNKAFARSSDFQDLRVYVATPNPQLNQMKFGDILSWNGHIGVVLNSSTLKIFQSNGYADHNCDMNFDLNHGPTMKNITPGFMDNFGPYKVLRFSDILPLHLTNGSSKKWKANPGGQTLYCGLSQINPPIAMDDSFTFSSNGTFTHTGGAVTSTANCNDGATYTSSWSLSPDRKTIFLGTSACTISIISKNNFKVTTTNGTLDLIPE